MDARRSIGASPSRPATTAEAGTWRPRAAALVALGAGFVGAGVAVVLAEEPAAAEPRPGPASAPRAAPAVARRVRIVATGDVTLGITPSLPPGGADALLAGVRPALEAGDVVLGNLETALADGGASKCGPAAEGCFAFRAPPAYAHALRRAGFNVLNLANNHAWDFGAAGQAETVAALDRAGLAHTGRPGEAAYVRSGGLTVAVLGFAPYPWAEDLLDLDRVRAAVVAAAREADLVVVTMHAGAEGEAAAHVERGPESYLGERRGDVVAFAHAAVDAGADLVAGHGPHVVRGLEWYRGRLIAYSLGNLSGHETLSTQGLLSLSAVLDVTLAADGTWRAGRIVPLRLLDGGRPTVDPTRGALGLLRSLSQADFGTKAADVTAGGAVVPPGTRSQRATR